MHLDQKISLSSGEKAHVVTPDAKIIALQCITGRAHISLRQHGVRWRFSAGEHCILRSGTSYKIVAISDLDIAVNSVENAQFQQYQR